MYSHDFKVYSNLESYSQDSANREQVLDSEKALSKTNCGVLTSNHCYPRLYRYLEVNLEYPFGIQDMFSPVEANLYNIFYEKHVHMQLQQ